MKVRRYAFQTLVEILLQGHAVGTDNAATTASAARHVAAALARAVAETAYLHTVILLLTDDNILCCGNRRCLGVGVETRGNN